MRSSLNIISTNRSSGRNQLTASITFENSREIVKNCHHSLVALMQQSIALVIFVWYHLRLLNLFCVCKLPSSREFSSLLFAQDRIYHNGQVSVQVGISPACFLGSKCCTGPEFLCFLKGITPGVMSWSCFCAYLKRCTPPYKTN